MDCSRPASRNPDEWLDHRPDFSRPICTEIRERILHWQPDLVEAIKWNMLCYSGRKLIFGISGCKKHTGLAFFRGMELDDPAGLFTNSEGNTSLRSIRITSPDSIDFAALRRLIHAAVALDASDKPPLPQQKREPLPVPETLAKALRRDKQAAAGFQKLSPSCQREYLVWLASAKRPETQQNRLAKILAAVRRGRKWNEREDG